ncbi:MAG TPA: SDR family oxidoreductase [Steroidobacteraceae bacterium]|jgi:UDP-glucose 4-epimerase|nr:SDR family oxidoreductase [Steroidobacteraceae bacterium]
MRRILVTGANGFIGSGLLRSLPASDWHVRGALRSLNALPARVQFEPVMVGEIEAATVWDAALRGVDSVVHLAARAHVMRESANEPLKEYRRVNVAGTLRLAQQAASAGVRRFIYMSSIKVNGEGSLAVGQPYHVDQAPAPVDPYGVSKHEAELLLRELAQETGMEIVVIRPVLVYGPGVKGNFLSMMRWLRKGIPLPFGAIDNRRSLVGVNNLVDLVRTCLDHPAAANQTFLVSDGEDLSTTELLRRLGEKIGTGARLLSVPSGMLVAAATLCGRRNVAQRLCGSLQVDISKTRGLLAWSPPHSVDHELERAAAAFLNLSSS